LISVLIANYNNEIFIVDAIQSVVNQSYNNWEIVVYDDKNKWTNIRNICDSYDLEMQAHINKMRNKE
jgi:teichuronic acid biosynthesis glycosyltransferase TuaG